MMNTKHEYSRMSYESRRKFYQCVVMLAYLSGKENAYEAFLRLNEYAEVNRDPEENDMDFVERMAGQDFDDGEDSLEYQDLLDEALHPLMVTAGGV